MKTHETVKAHATIFVNLFNSLLGVLLQSCYLPADIWDYTLDYIRDVSLKFADQELYVIFGPVFDYDADGLADDDLTAARYTTLLNADK